MEMIGVVADGKMALPTLVPCWHAERVTNCCMRDVSTEPSPITIENMKLDSVQVCQLTVKSY